MRKFNYFKEMEKYFDEVRNNEFLMSLSPSELVQLIDQAIPQLMHRNTMIYTISRFCLRVFAMETGDEKIASKSFEEGEERSKDLEWARLIDAGNIWKEHLNPENAMFYFPPCYMYKIVLEAMKELLESGQAANWMELNIIIDWGIKKWESNDANPFAKIYLEEKKQVMIFDEMRELFDPYLERHLELRRIDRRMSYLESIIKMKNTGTEVF